jgi:hypothetical protein
LSRLRFLVLFAALAVLAVAFSACGGSSSSKSGEDPQKVINEATLKGIKSGKLNLSLKVNAEGKEGGNLNVNLSGPFQSEGEASEQLPELDMTAKVNGSFNGENIDFEGGLTLLPDRAYVNYKGTEYAVDPTTFSFVKSAIEQAQKRSQAKGESTKATACQEAVANLKVGDFVKNLSNEGSSEVGGTTTTKISGDLDAAGAIEALVGLTKNSACAVQLGAAGGAAGPLPSGAELEKAKGQVESAVKRAHIDVYVGDDNIVRKISAELTIEPPSGSGSGPKKVDLSLELELTEVNKEQTITAPSGAKPLDQLFQKLGVNPIELLGGANGQSGLSGAGLGNLLKGLSGASGSGGENGGSSGGASAGGQKAYAECLSGASSAADVAKCAKLLK